MKSRTYLAIELLTSFNIKEQEDFKHFVSCKYFNSDEKIIVLLNFLFKKVKYKIDLKDIKLEEIYNAIYKLKKVKLNKNESGVIYAKMHTMLALAQQFLMIISLDKSKYLQTELLQKELLDRKQFDVYNKYFTKTQTHLVEQKYQNIEYYRHKFILSSGNFEYCQLTGNSAQISVLNDFKKNISHYYLFNILDAQLNELSLKEYTSKYIDDTIFTAATSLFELPVFKNHYLVEIYSAFIKLMVEQDDLAFLSLKEELLKRSDKLSIENQINFYNTLLNFCVLQMRKGKAEYKRRQFDLLRIMDDNNLLLTKNQMHIGNLHNIVFASCNVSEYDWAVQMINKYYNYLPIHLRDAVKNHNLGLIAYFQRNFQLAIDYLFHLPNINLFHDINRRSLMIKAFYELDVDYKETTHTLFRSFEKYIGEHKSIPVKRKTSFKNFIRTLINLYRIKHDVTKMKLENVKKKIKAQELNSNKNWLLEKVAELEN